MRSITTNTEHRAHSSLLRAGLVLIALAFWLLPGTAWPAEISVDCSNPRGKVKTIADALAKLDKQAENTIHVAGTCNESLEIIGFANLSLIADEGASINDPTPDVPDDNIVAAFYDSGIILLEGFSIHGGAYGVSCSRVQLCEIRNNTIEGGYEAGVGGFSNASLYVLDDMIQNNPWAGVEVNSEVHARIYGGTIQQNGYGVVVGNGSTLTFFKGTSGGPVIVQDNSGAGVSVDTNSTLTLFRGTAVIRSNGYVGLDVGTGSVAVVNRDNEIRDNLNSAVQIGDLSLVRFSGSSTISGGPPAVNCVGKYAVAAGDLTGIDTNCLP